VAGRLVPPGEGQRPALRLVPPWAVLRRLRRIGLRVVGRWLVPVLGRCLLEEGPLELEEGPLELEEGPLELE
jgi:hypothetical protein